MELLPFLQSASQYSAIITVALYGLLSLQFKVMASGIRREMAERTRDLEKSEDNRHARIDLALVKIQETIHSDLHQLETSMLKTFGDHGQRIAALEGRNRNN